MKKLKHIYYIAICSGLILLNACTKDADVKLPVVTPKLVVTSFLSPQDTLIIATVSLSQPLYNNTNAQNYSVVNNATVQLSNGINTCTLSYDSINNYYSISAALFPITVGTTYHLTVTTPDGKNINASTTIPNANSSLTATTNATTNQNNGNEYFIDAKWNDASGTEDYYRLVYYSKYFDTNISDTTYYLSSSDNFTDSGKDGTLLSTNMSIYDFGDPNAQDSGELCLVHASKEYYLYHTKIRDAVDSNGPFSEPVIMYTNINGGFGVFAGFNQFKTVVVF